MGSVVDKRLWTIDDLSHLKAYIAAMEFMESEDHEAQRQSALSGSSNPTYSGQPMPIFRGGETNFRFRNNQDNPNYEDYDAAVEYFRNVELFDSEVPQLMHNGVRSFEMPSSDKRPTARVQEDSLLYHASLFREQVEDFVFPPEWLKEVSERWPSTSDHFVDWLQNFDRLYDKACDAVTKTSSTGCSVQLGTTKGNALSANSNTVKAVVFQRLLLLLTTPEEDLMALTPVELVQKGFVDPIRVFLKREPHKYGKRFDSSGKELPLKRWRIISSCSLVDELVDRVLYTLQNKTEIRRWHETPSMPGVGFSDDASADSFFYKVLFPHAGKEFLLLDFSGWDWGLKQDMLFADADVRSNRCGGKDMGTFRKRAVTVGFSVFVLDDGTYYEQCIRGIMKSGWLNTSSTNSRDRALITLLAVAKAAVAREEDPLPLLRYFFIIAMGDDSVEEKHEETWDEFMFQLHQWGLRPDPQFTGETTDVKHINFCSHDFDITPFGQVHANLRGHVKSVSKFLYLPRTKRCPEQIAGIRNALRHTPELKCYEGMWRAICPELWAASWSCDVGECRD